MSAYCKAYLAEDLRRFPGWSEQNPPAVARAEGDGESETAASAYFYLHDDFVVTAGVYRDEQVVFDQVTDSWRTFCRSDLGFDVPGAGLGGSV